MTKTEERGVRFVPSRVDGVSGVREVAVFPDRLEVLGDRGWVAVPFADFAQGAEKRGFFTRNPKLGRVGAILYSTEKYADSHIRFLTDPPITIYMPADGPTQFPNSVFWRIQRTITAGRYEVIDSGGPPPRINPVDALPPPLRRLFMVLFFSAMINFVAFVGTTLVVGGGPRNVENGHYYVGRSRHKTEVSRETWVWLTWHERTMAATHLLAIVGGGALMMYGQAHARRNAKKVVPIARGAT